MKRICVGFVALLAFAALLPACGCSKSAAKFFRSDDQNKAAEQRWKRVRAGVKRKLADSQFQSGNMDTALRELEEAIALDPTDAESYVLLTRIRLEQGQVAAARQAAQEAITRGPDNAEAAYVAGIVAERCEQWELAEKQYGRAQDAAPREAEYVMARAEALVALGRAVEALDLVESCADRFIDDARLRCVAARIYRQLGMDAAAADRFEQAARASDDDADLKLELGMALAAAGRDVEAAGILTPLLERGLERGTGVSPVSDSVEAPPALRATPSHEIALARSLHRLGRLDEARRRLDAVVRVQRDDGLAWLLLAQVAADQRDWRAARQAADQAVRLRGDQAEPHLMNAYVCVQQNDFDAAVQSARLAIQRDARDATGYCLLGQGYEGRGESGPARDAYFDALVHDPQSALARALLTRLGDAKANEAAPTAPAHTRRTAMILGNDVPTTEVETP